MKRPDQAATTPPPRGAFGLSRLLTPVLVFSAVINLLMLTGSIYMLQVYDRVLSSGSVPTLMALFFIVVVLFGFLAVFDMLRSRLLSRAGLHLDARLGPAAFGDTLKGGPAVADIGTLRGGLASPVATALLDLPFVPLFLGVLFLVHPWLGWLTLAGAAASGVLALLARRQSERSLRRTAPIDAVEREIIEGGRRAVETVQAMGMQGALTGLWRRLRDRGLALAQEGTEPAEALSAMSKSFRLLLQSAILTLGAFLVLQGQITAGMIIAASILSGRALAPIDQIVGQWRMIATARQAWARLAALPPATGAEAERVELPDPEGHLTVSGLTYRHPSAAERKPILEDVSFALKPGDALGIIGKSASGKTTLARLLTGIVAPDAGEVRLDGATLDQWPEDRRGRLIGYLAQGVEILPGTVRDNIARFDPDARDADVIAAARIAGVHEMILQLPEGYGTRIGAMAGAVPLSGGQMQRVALARAAYGRPALVVLDEPNSNLDSAGETALRQTILALRETGSCVIVIAHRASVLAATNTLMVLDGGRMKAFGPREEVMARAKKKPAARPVEAPAAAAAAASISPLPRPDGDVRPLWPRPARKTA